MMISKHPLAGTALLVWVTTAAATPLLQNPTHALAVGQDLQVAQLAGGTPQAPNYLADSIGLPALRTAGTDSPPPSTTSRSSKPVAAQGDAGQAPDNISADVWAQIAALSTAACAALGLLLLKRSAARTTITANNTPAGQAALAKTEPKRRRVAYRL